VHSFGHGRRNPYPRLLHPLREDVIQTTRMKTKRPYRHRASEEDLLVLRIRSAVLQIVDDCSSDIMQ
jgi:hypothetical protein